MDRRTFLAGSAAAGAEILSGKKAGAAESTRRNNLDSTGRLTLYQGDFTNDDIKVMDAATMKRLRGNVAETAAKIPDRIERKEFEVLQGQLLRDLEASPYGAYPTPKSAIENLAKVAHEDLKTMLANIPPGQYGLFIDADTQQLHLVQKTGNALLFMLSARTTTGKDGLSPNPPPESNATKSGLSLVQSVAKGSVVPNEDVSYRKDLAFQEEEFTIRGRDEKKSIYIARHGNATVGLIGFYFYKGQALHEGPIMSQESSHGCVRANGRVIAMLDGYIKVGTPFMIYGSKRSMTTNRPGPSLSDELPGWRDMGQTPSGESPSRKNSERSPRKKPWNPFDDRNSN